MSSTLLLFSPVIDNNNNITYRDVPPTAPPNVPVQEADALLNPVCLQQVHVQHLLPICVQHQRQHNRY
jgi:hypothetical protein